MGKIEDMREALKPNKEHDEKDYDVMPDDIIVGIEGNPDDYVEMQAHSLAAMFSDIGAKGENETISDYNELIRTMIGQADDEDIAKVKSIISDERAHAAIFMDLAAKYDMSGVAPEAVASFQQLLRQSKNSVAPTVTALKNIK